ncbi:TonB-dependent receptor domain-containing protein [Aliikangiella coralliicola]|uniref:TonB-dependent receptor n=1 Tax=Aliikangiella coralliicola TaxID=2592383 RepID=A0A545U7N0_9GAMM|nr:TonB-dependent receptor [Aliikangiella coralliicola]TQV85469.1 TonB-dependent receptor [Aliikangiella coralliicola]
MLVSNKHSKLSKAIRFALVCGTLSSASFAANTFAAETEAEEDEESQKIVITGSRIKRSNLMTASPVTTVGSEDFTIRGITKVEDLLNELPQVFPGQVSGTANGAVGTATVDLRFLGAQRTLTLIDGRRLPTGSPKVDGAGADINQIPAALIERVELLTGGSSATYGSDAIAGVINFIMKRDFEGVSVDYQYSFYQHDNDNSMIQNLVTTSGFETADGSVSDGDTHDFSILIGANSANGKGNVTAYATIRDIEAITQDSRDYSSCALDLDANNNLECAGSSTIPNTRVTDFAGGFDFQVAGTDFVPFNSLYNYGPLNHFQRPDQRRTAGVFAHYEISDDAEMYAEFNFMDDKSNAQIAPSGAFFVTNTIPCSNPFLSAQQFQQLCGQFGLTAADVQTAYVGRRNVEGGPRNHDLRHTSYRGLVGVKGDINESWSYDAFTSYSTVVMSEVYNNDLSTTKIIRALNATTDANGNIVCQSVIDGSDPNCVPWNVFETGAVTDAMVNYLVLPLFATGETESKQTVAFLSGDLTDAGVVMPGASDGASIVVGLEYREDTLDYNPDQGFISGDGAGQGGPTSVVSGKLDVNEVFSEFSLPIVEDSDFANYITVDLGYRYSDYSTGKTTDTYKVALDWEVNDSLKFRASFQSATRHANIRELFEPIGIGLFNMDEDPCAGATPTYTAEQCARTGVTADRYGTIADSPAGQYNGLEGGNPDLEPEESETTSFGVVFQPMEGLDVALDYFKIDVQDAIDTIPAEFILEKCAIDNLPEFCAMINRGPAQTLWVGQDNIIQNNLNIGFLETEGIDFDVSYEFEMGENGKLNFNLLGTHLLAFDKKPTPVSDVIECAGFWDRNACENPRPEWRWNLVTTWVTPWDMSITGTLRYFGEVDELNNGPTDLDAETYLDVGATWDVMDSTTLRFGIKNLLDEEPPIIPNAPSGVGNGNAFPGSYDILGRYIFAGVTYRL